MKKSLFLLFLGILGFGMQSCTDKVESELFHYTDEEYQILSQSLDLPEETHNYTLVTNRPIPGFNPDLPFHKATLGRVLFYDKMLSVDGSTSCASCHKQSAAFADDTKFSEGLEGNIGTRNSLPLGNTIGFVRYYGTDLSIQSGFFSWDEKFETINDQSRAAITSELEMGHDMYSLVENIKDIDYYNVLFKRTYGENGINEDNVLDALTDFVNSMSSRESEFDKAFANNVNTFDAFIPFSDFSPAQNRGKELFNSNCSNCHGSSHNAIVLSSANNGLDMIYEDKGLGAKDGNQFLDGVFKVPSLRNIELTGPYMHDGRFSTLEEVVDHYSSGIQNHKNLSQFLKSGNQARKFNFSDQDKEDLIIYLQSLTDNDFVSQEKYSDPFK